MNKKLGILLLAVLLCFAACGNDGKEAGKGVTEPTKAATVTEAPEVTKVPEVTATPEPTATPVPVEPDYAKLAVQAENMVKDYVEALKAGDVEAILSMTKPDSDLYKELSLIKDYKTTAEFLQAMFAGSCYYMEGTSEDTERNIKSAIEDGDSDFYLHYVDMAMPDKLHFSEFIPNAMFEDGELIPEDYAPATNEEAMQVVKAVAKELPVTLQNIKLTTPDENGKMYVKSGTDYFDFLFDTLYERDLTEDFVINYVTEESEYLGGRIVNSPDGVYEEDDEIWKQLLPMIEQKDMAGMFEYHITLTGKDLRDSSENTFVYGDVKNLTPEQQAYVDSYIDRIVFYHCDLTSESWDGTMRRDSDLMYIVPVLDYDEEKQAWLLENNITEVSNVYIFEPDRCIETLTHPYLNAALYAKDDDVPALIPAWTGKTEESTGTETEAPEGTEETESFVTEMLYTVILTDVGAEKIKAIKLYRDVTGAGLAEAKAAVESAPCLLLETSEQAAAEKVRADFEAIGAMITVNIEVAEGKELPKEDGRYVITLLDAGTEKVKVIKAYREATGLGLKECKDAVESAPCTVIEVTNKVDAELIAATFTEIGATVEIKEAE
ncbi:MAG: ribosomal protein L7/L12 [Lachnospiraceae bacterium]|nr:ribosomal protein L7/L12 [Lachnospiraceae bacterium]